MSPTVSIILVNYNCRSYVDGLFQSLREQTFHDFEVLVFNNRSDDGSIELIRTAYPDAQIFEMGGNTGFSKPNNEGIRRAHGTYVLCLNFDIILGKDFLEEMVQAIESEPAIGWVAGKMLKLTPAGKTENIDCLGHHMTKRRYAVERDYSVPFSWQDYSARCLVFGASACAALYKREMLEDIAINGEYFDEDFFAYFEDVDLDWRAQLRGWKCLYAPTAIGYHARYGTGLIKNPEIAGCLLSNRLFMMIKNDTFSHFMQDIWPITRTTIADMRLYARENRSAVFVAIKRLAALAGKMFAKRRVIKSRQKVAAQYLRQLIK